MADALEFNLNGQPVRIENWSPNTTLLEYLRATGKTGTKEGCAEGDCGACSVAILERDSHGKACFRSVNSCLMPLPLLAGREVVTVEGVAQGQLHPVQKAMVENYGSQCGYCTPGIILSLFEGFYRDDLKTLGQLDDQLCGNLCRCTGYRPIRDAALEAFSEKQASQGAGSGDCFDEKLRTPEVKLGIVEYKAAHETFFRPTSLLALLKLMAEFPQARLIAGATELGLDITKKFKRFPTLISVEAVPELTEIRSTETEWHIGAATTLTRLEEVLGREFPALAQMLRLFGSRQIRNRATLGGNLVTASPIGDSAPVLLAFEARVVLASAQGEREISLDDFFVSYRKTALQPNEILKSVILPRPVARAGLTRLREFYKVSKRREMDISTVAACFAIELDERGRIQSARLAYGGVAPTSVRAKKTEQALLGKPWNAQTILEVRPVLGGEFKPISDVRGSEIYRCRLVTSLLEKFFHEQVQLLENHEPVSLDAPLTPSLSASEGERVPEGTAVEFRSQPRVGRSVPLSQRFPNALAAAARQGRLALPASLDLMAVVPEGGVRGHPHSSVVAEASTSMRPVPHESAHKHVTGEALYTDDQAARQPMLEVWPVCSPYAHARILKRDASLARGMPGVQAVLLAEDIPGLNDVGAVKREEILLADKEALFHGHLVALVVGDSLEFCRRAAEKVVVDYEPLPHLLRIEDAIAANSFHNEPNFIRRGDVEQALRNSELTLEGDFSLGGQEHFYLEMQAAWAQGGEDNSMFVVSSTQHPSEVQHIVAHLLHVPVNKVVVQCPRMGGGFGGKETQAATPAALAALAAYKTGRAVRVRFNRDQDMILTGKRHPFRADFKVGFDSKGFLRAAKIDLISNGGWSLDLSQAVTDRALFHLDNAYYIPEVEFSGRVAKTNIASNTAFRGFGGPQGMLVIEEILDRVARSLGLPVEEVREKNLYRGRGESNTTPYGQEIEDNRIQRIWHELKQTSQFNSRREQINAWNKHHPHCKRGLAITPVKFGISFTVTHLNQAGAFVLIYQDGTVQVNHGATEMGQGVHTNIIAIAAREFGLSRDRIRVMSTSTDKVPNTSATAASCGTDLNGAAVKNACEILRSRLIPVAAKWLAQKTGREVAAENVLFADNSVFIAEHPESRFTFAEVVQQAYLERISLSSTGYYRTPEIRYDRAQGRGKPFYYFAVGAAVTEVEVDGFTGMTQVLRTDILHDVGDSINAGVNRGQIEGGFVQGMGWLTNEELKWDDQGKLLTHSPDTYKIPAVGDMPFEFNIAFLTNATQPNVVYGSKAVGEPPLMLAISVREAIRNAIAAFGPQGGQVALPSPATAEAIFLAIQERVAGLADPKSLTLRQMAEIA